MKTYKYKDYNHYVMSQLDGFHKKKNNVWVKKENIRTICDYLKPFNPRSGLCHGVRGGAEQEYFMEYLDCLVIGTEIGGAITPNTIEWDFNKKNKAWMHKFDFVYSNAYDHAYKPRKTLRIWAGQVKPGGHIIIEYDKRNEHTGEVSKPVNKIDPLSITIDEMIELFPVWLDCTVEVLDMPVVGVEYQKAVILHVPEK